MFVEGWKEEVDKQRLQQVYVWKGFIFFNFFPMIF